MRTHIINGHYMFGNTFMQPSMPFYNHIKHHIMAPINRPMPPYPDLYPSGSGSCLSNDGKCLCFETEGGEKIDCPYAEPDSDETCSCEDCPFTTSGIVRDPLAYSIVNIETEIVKTLKMTLYGTTSDKDTTVEMKVGSKYAITYITERGLVTSVGNLELISTSIPDSCTRYLGGTNNLSTAASAYIGMDCSTAGHSDKRKIYISTIRAVQAIEDDDTTTETEETKTLRERLEELITAIENGELVFCDKNCSCSTDDSTSDDSTSDSSDSTDDSSTDSDTSNDSSTDTSGDSTDSSDNDSSDSSDTSDSSNTDTSNSNISDNSDSSSTTDETTDSSEE